MYELFSRVVREAQKWSDEGLAIDERGDTRMRDWGLTTNRIKLRTQSCPRDPTPLGTPASIIATFLLKLRSSQRQQSSYSFWRFFLGTILGTAQPPPRVFSRIAPWIPCLPFGLDACRVGYARGTLCFGPWEMGGVSSTEHCSVPVLP